MIHKKKIRDNVKRNVEELSRIGKIFFKRPLLKFFIFLFIQIILINISRYFSEFHFIRVIIDITSILISIYFVFILIYLARVSLKKLLNPENLLALILSYAIFILGVLIFFSTLYSISENIGLGYLKYGMCSDDFQTSMISADSFLSRNYFYFSAITFFSVGYGDICPMGFAKMISIMNAFTGHLVNVVLVALILNNYLRKKEESNM
ncbi:MAG: ion channel [Candidatus Pacearchaeota archaeon]|jgi:potassium channel LctB